MQKKNTISSRKKAKKTVRKVIEAVRSDKDLGTERFVKKEESFLPKIKLVGIGGAGGNALTRMQGLLRGVETIALNTDVQDFKMCEASRKIQIGKAAASGRGAGMNPEIGRQSAEESSEEIEKVLEGAELVFVTCGLGGGTGSGAAPVVARIARSKGILCVAIVTMPFSFEGSERHHIATQAWSQLHESVDALITVSNDRVFNVIAADTSLKKAFWHIDEILREGVRAIYDVIMKPGLINVDFADVKSILQNSGSALLGMGMARGKDRAQDAAKRAIASPLLDMTIENAHRVLFHIASREDLTMFEVQQAAQTVTSSISQDARVIFGATFDHSLEKGDLKITVIASGFDEPQKSFTGRALPLYERKETNQFKQEEEPIAQKDILGEKIKQFENLDEPAFLRRKKMP